jgi:hypothetical protein
MCIIELVYTADELKALDKKSRASLQKLGTRLVHTSRDIRNIVKKDPKVRKKLRTKLRPALNRLKRQ